MTIVSTIDSRSVQCPVFLLAVNREMKKLMANEALEVVGDDPGLLRDLIAFVKNQGKFSLRVAERDGLFKVHILLNYF